MCGDRKPPHPIRPYPGGAAAVLSDPAECRFALALQQPAELDRLGRGEPGDRAVVVDSSTVVAIESRSRNK